MKLLKCIIKSQEGSLDKQILSWLCWLKHNCDLNKKCADCKYSRYGGSDCEVYSTFTSKYPHEKFATPNCWKFERASSILQEPPDLNFLTQLEWDEEGVPVLPSEYTGDSI